MKKAYYFMPDISGFTEFVNTTEIDHSIHIISELLEILIDINHLDLKLVEIEGDALFMYTTKKINFQELLKQVFQMSEAFHRHIKEYETKRICSCGACKTTHNLQLKFVFHYGDLNFIKVKNFVKPYGIEVIKIHRLLKNNISSNEYLLLTNAVFSQFTNELDDTWHHTKEIYDAREINYVYKDLSFIASQIILKKEVGNDSEIKIPKYILNRTIHGSMDELFKLVAELKYRHLWDLDVKRIEFDENKINRVGTNHNCVLQFGNLNFSTITDKIDSGKVYGEKTNDMIFTRDFHYIIRFHKISENETALKLELYLDFTSIGNLMSNKIIKMLKKVWNKKLSKLAELIEKNN